MTSKYLCFSQTGLCDKNPFYFGCSSGKVLGLTSMVHDGKEGAGRDGEKLHEIPQTFLSLWRKSSFTQITALTWRSLNLIIDTVKWFFFSYFSQNNTGLSDWPFHAVVAILVFFYCIIVNCLWFVLFCVCFLEFLKGPSKNSPFQNSSSTNAALFGISSHYSIYLFMYHKTFNVTFSFIKLTS